MRVLVFGAGVIGSLYAGKLLDNGFYVTIFARGDRYDELAARGFDEPCDE